MSVMIKGMGMPNGCYDCPILQSCDGCFDFECPFNSYLHWHNAEDVINYIPDSCLLVAVPTPHGRLIDADALMECRLEPNHYEELKDGYIPDYDLDSAPTIIEAEVSE